MHATLFSSRDEIVIVPFPWGFALQDTLLAVPIKMEQMRRSRGESTSALYLHPTLCSNQSQVLYQGNAPRPQIVVVRFRTQLSFSGFRLSHAHVLTMTRCTEHGHSPLIARIDCNCTHWC